MRTENTAEHSKVLAGVEIPSNNLSLKCSTFKIFFSSGGHFPSLP